MTQQSARPIMFFCYAPEDQPGLEALKKHLAMPLRTHVQGWSDDQILAGSERQSAIAEALEQASVIVLVVSASFLASSKCYEDELSRAMERHHRSEALVIPVLWRSCLITGAPFENLQPLPRKRKAIERPGNDKALAEVAQGILQAIERFLGPTTRSEPTWETLQVLSTDLADLRRKRRRHFWRPKSFVSRPEATRSFDEFRASSNDTMVVLGDPGLGKTELLHAWSETADGPVLFAEFDDAADGPWTAIFDRHLETLPIKQQGTLLTLLTQATSARPTSRVLVVLDNVERHRDVRRFLQELQRDLFPFKGAVQVLCAMRWSAWPHIAGPPIDWPSLTIHRLDPLSTDEANEILQMHCAEFGVADLGALPRAIRAQCWNPFFISTLARTISISGKPAAELDQGPILDSMFNEIVRTSAAHRDFLAVALANAVRMSGRRAVKVRELISAAAQMHIPLTWSECVSTNPNSLLGSLVAQGVLYEFGDSIACTHDYLLEYFVARSLKDDLDAGGLTAVIEQSLSVDNEPLWQALCLLPGMVSHPTLLTLAQNLLKVVVSYAATETDKEQESERRTRDMAFRLLARPSNRPELEILENTVKPMRLDDWRRVGRSVEVLGRLYPSAPDIIGRLFEPHLPIEGVVDRIFLRLFKAVLLDITSIRRLRNSDPAARCAGYWLLFELLHRNVGISVMEDPGWQVSIIDDTFRLQHFSDIDHYQDRELKGFSVLSGHIPLTVLNIVPDMAASLVNDDSYTLPLVAETISLLLKLVHTVDGAQVPFLIAFQRVPSQALGKLMAIYIPI